MDAVTRVLLDDSFERKDFTVLNGNKTCVDEVLSNRIHNELGRFPYEASDQERNAYNQKSQVLRDKLMNEIAPRLKPLLIQTEGILLPSLMPHIEESPDKIAMRVSALKDLLGDLTHGGGPTNAQLSALEAELVAMVYRTDPHTVLTLWSKILGREGDIPVGLATTHYQMEWRRTELRLDSEIDHRGLSALLSALEFASRFRTHYRADMFEACRHLSPKRLQDDARDVLSLAQHLGVLFALADEDRNIRTWLENGKHNLEELIEAGPRAGELLGSLEKLLTVDLKDAFSARVQEFCAAIPAADAEILTSKLDLPNGRDDEATASDLSNTLRTTYEVVLEKYEQWIAVQRRRLVAKEVSGIGSAMFARVSKSPAAFFAKEAAAICTRLNTDMWVEERNSHMLVFAPDGKRLMGMALIYLQKVNAIDPHRNTLIIRAINPMQDALATFSASSIVDSYFDVAIRIAHDVGAVAVAFPHPTGMDLMSNNPTIEKDIKARFIEPSVNAPYRSSEKASLPSLLQPHRISEIFYAFESGEAPVEQLFAIWRSGPPINE